MLDEIANGEIDAVVVYDSDRFYRQPRELEEFLDVCEAANVTQFAQTTGDIDLGSPDGRLMLRMKAAVAVKESDDKSRRIKRKHVELAETGKVGGGGIRPFGYEQDRKSIRPDEAEVLVEIVGRIMAGESARSLAFELNDRGIKTTTGKDWAPGVLTRMLKRARISGEREHKGEIVGPAEWPGIITPEQGARLRALLSNPARRTNERARKYLLAGLLRCKRCGAPLVSRPRGDKRRRYVCARRPESDACGKLAILADDLEAFVVAGVIARLDSPEFAQALAAVDADSPDVFQQIVNDATAQLDELASLYADQAITASEWVTARSSIEQRLESAKTALAKSNGAGAVAGFVGNGATLHDEWAELPLSRQRAMLAAVLDHVTIAPATPGAREFEPERVTFHWRGA
jgi:hypothetical protein